MEKIKVRVTDYWTQRADAFSEQRLKEFASDKRELWMREFKKYIPMDKPLKILDVGTGTGFFAFLLSAEGHHTVGIDLTEKMIEEAKNTSKTLGIGADFYVMDAELPNFMPHAFDVIVSRNLTWTLPHLETAYSSWYSLLKPGGILINFDADYCHVDQEQEKQEDQVHKNIVPELMAEYEKIKETLTTHQKKRPAWDEELLTKAGFHHILIDTKVWKRIYRQKDEFYNPIPIFTIVARV